MCERVALLPPHQRHEDGQRDADQPQRTPQFILSPFGREGSSAPQTDLKNHEEQFPQPTDQDVQGHRREWIIEGCPICGVDAHKDQTQRSGEE